MSLSFDDAGVGIAALVRRSSYGRRDSLSFPKMSSITPKPDVVGVSIDGLRGDQVYNDNLTGNLLLDQLSGLGGMDDIFWERE